MNPVNAQEYIQQHQPRRWSRSTVADGKWMQDKTFTPLNDNDEQLGKYIDQIIEGLNTEITDREQAVADEAAARLAYDGILSGRCDFLYTSAQQIRQDLTKESEYRASGDEATLNAAKTYTNTTSAYVFGHANDASAYALAEAKTYTNTTSAYVFGHTNDASAYALSEANKYTDTASENLDKRIDGVSSTFNSYSSVMNTWKTGINDWRIGINTWSANINSWKDTTDDCLSGLQGQIDAIEMATDVIDVVSTTAALNPYQGTVTSGDIIKVLSGSNGEQDYYKWNGTGKKKTNPPFSEFTLVGSLSPYYSKSETYTQAQTQSLIDEKLRYKVDASSAQDFTSTQQWQARQNIGASDGKIQWWQPATGQTLQSTSADLSITYKKTGDTYYRLRANDGTTSQDWALVPEPTDEQNNYLLTVTTSGIEWQAPSAELPTVTSPDDVGKSLMVAADGSVCWRNSPYFIVANNSSEYFSDENYAELAAAVSRNEEVIIQFAGTGFTNFYRLIGLSSIGYVFSCIGQNGVIKTISHTSEGESGHLITTETRSFVPQTDDSSPSGAVLKLDANKTPTWASEHHVSYDASQGLTTAQQRNARKNISAMTRAQLADYETGVYGLNVINGNYRCPTEVSWTDVQTTKQYRTICSIPVPAHCVLFVTVNAQLVFDSSDQLEWAICIGTSETVNVTNSKFFSNIPNVLITNMPAMSFSYHNATDSSITVYLGAYNHSGTNIDGAYLRGNTYNISGNLYGPTVTYEIRKLATIENDE